MRLLLASIACCLFFITCQKSSTGESLTPAPDTFNSMNGKIIWPVSLALDTTGLKVSTFHSAASIKENKFTVDTINKFSTVFVTDAKGDVKMMRYNYPQQKDNDISPNSTALALLMNAPIVNSLSDEGQVAMINKIQLDPNFPLLEDEVKKAIASNKSITDTNNTSLILATSKLFENVSRSRSNVYRAVPLKITTANPATFSFANNNVSHKYVIGVYKNNSRIQKLVVNGTQSFAASFKDVLDGLFGNGYSTPDAKIYSNTADGNLDFKIRSGAPGTDNNSTEYKEAFRENIVNYIVEIASSYMPFDNKCTKTAYDGIVSIIESTPSFAAAKTPSDFATLATGFCSDMFNTRADLFENCSHYKDPNYKNPFWKAAGKLLKFFNKVGQVGQGMNISAHVYDLYNSRAAIDTCFSITDKKVGECTNPIVGWYKGTYTLGVSGQYYCGDHFGKQESFYFYINVNDKFGTLIKSFNSTMPDLLSRHDEGKILKWSDGTVHCTPRGSIINSDGFSYIGLPLLRIVNGKISTSSTSLGRAGHYIDPLIRRGKCAIVGYLTPADDHDFFYGIKQISGAFFHATTPPPELTSAEVNAILDRVK